MLQIELAPMSQMTVYLTYGFDFVVLCSPMIVDEDFFSALEKHKTSREQKKSRITSLT